MEKLKEVLDIYEEINVAKLIGRNVNNERLEALKKASNEFNNSTKKERINTTSDDLMLESIKNLITSCLTK